MLLLQIDEDGKTMEAWGHGKVSALHRDRFGNLQIVIPAILF
jgi:hypothetical protein